MADEIATQARYPLLSGLFLLSIPLSGLIGYLVVGSANYAWINAVGLLIVPVSIFCWIFTTIRAVHLVGVRFWFVPSTYVALVGGVIALLICLVMGLFVHEAARQGHQVQDVTLYIAAAILYGSWVVWSYFYQLAKDGIGNSIDQSDAPSGYPPPSSLWRCTSGLAVATRSDTSANMASADGE